MLTQNLNLMYVDDIDPAAGGEDPAPQEPVVTEPPSGGGNPAWDEIRSLVDPETFSKIEPKLKDWDSGVEKRLNTEREKYKPYEEILNGRTPEYLQSAVTYADWLDSDPQGVAERLAEYLQEQGLTPKQAAKEADSIIAESTPDEDESQTADPNVRRLEAQLTELKNEGLRQQAAVKLEASIAQLRKDHAEMDDEDVKEVLNRAALAAQRLANTPGAKFPSLEDTYQELAQYNNRILSRARPGDSAPVLVPPGGGAATGQQARDWGKLSRTEMQDSVAALLDAAKGKE